jgi:hypothetical protein
MKLSFLNLHNYKYRHILLKSLSWFSLEVLDGYNILNLKLNSQLKKTYITNFLFMLQLSRLFLAQPYLK